MKKTIITIMALATMMSITACGNVTSQELTTSELREYANEYMTLTMEEMETMRENRPDHYEFIKSCFEEYRGEYLD